MQRVQASQVPHGAGEEGREGEPTSCALRLGWVRMVRTTDARLMCAGAVSRCPIQVHCKGLPNGTVLLVARKEAPPQPEGQFANRRSSALSNTVIGYARTV